MEAIESRSRPYPFTGSECFNSTFSGNSAIREILLWSPMHVSKCATVPLDKRETVTASA